MDAIRYAIRTYAFGFINNNMIITGPVGTTSIDTTGVEMGIGGTHILSYKVCISKGASGTPVEYVASVPADAKDSVFQSLTRVLSDSTWNTAASESASACGITDLDGKLIDA